MSKPASPIPVSELKSRLSSDATSLCIDVRRESDFVQAGRLIAGSQRRDPLTVEGWGPSLTGQTVVVYCAHGRAVSQGACQQLIDMGVDASYLEGGYSAWLESQGPTTAWSAA